MSDTYSVKTFGGLEITNDNVTVNIVELFGKQLVNLLQVLLFHSEKPVQKDELIDILWPESKNPSSALKFSIFRLRAELNEIEFFKDKEVIVTTRKGYILNPNLDWNIDFVELEKAYNPPPAGPAPAGPLGLGGQDVHPLEVPLPILDE